MSTFYLVSCVGQKGSQPAPASQLYQSDWFTKARSFVEARSGSWAILSAEHGVVLPGEEIAPYERTLNTMKIAERREWAARVRSQLAGIIPAGAKVVILAGTKYREFLVDHLEASHEVEIPMKGLGIGSQKQWLASHPAPIAGEQLELFCQNA